MGVSGGKDQGIQPAHLFFQEAYSIFDVVGPEGIAAHQLAEKGRMVGRIAFSRAHFVEDHRDPPPGQLPGGFTAGQPGSDNMDGHVYKPFYNTVSSL